MSNDETKKKIAEICAREYDEWVEEDYARRIVRIDFDKLADALIAAGIGDLVSLTDKWREMLRVQAEKTEQAERRAEIAERALRNAAPRLNCRGGIGKGFCKVDKCDYYHCNNDEGCIKAHLEQAEKELAEERKDD